MRLSDKTPAFQIRVYPMRDSGEQGDTGRKLLDEPSNIKSKLRKSDSAHSPSRQPKTVSFQIDSRKHDK